MPSRTYTGFIETLPPNGIFVFGSNTEGRHGAGAAKYARDHFGALYGQACGRQGQSYALVTKDLNKPRDEPSRTSEEICSEIQELYVYAQNHPQLKFFVAYSGKGKNLNNYTATDMAIMFGSCGEIPPNILFEETFWNLIQRYDTPGPQVYNVKDKLIPHGCVYIGRKSKWGNPYVLGTHGNRDEVCDLHEQGLTPEDVTIIRNELHGKHLLCHCTPLRCHGDTLLRIANT